MAWSWCGHSNWCCDDVLYAENLSVGNAGRALIVGDVIVAGWIVTRCAYVSVLIGAKGAGVIWADSAGASLAGVVGEWV